MAEAVKEERYEDAAKIKKQIVFIAKRFKNFKHFYTFLMNDI